MIRLHYLWFLLAFAFFSCNTKQQEAETGAADETLETDMNTENEPDIQPEKPMEYVVIQTSKGDIHVELDPEHAPVTVENFLTYVDSGFYDGTVFHRVISDFMIQGGGFTPEGQKKETRPPIRLESQNGLSNTVGTIAMARTQAPHTATAQFFINVRDNEALDYRPGSDGYAVFGRVTSGMDVVNDIRSVKTANFNGHADWPVEPVIIEKVYRD